MATEKQSPASGSDFRKQIFGSNAANNAAMRASAKQSSVITQHFARNSQAGLSELSENRVNSNVSKTKLRGDESSLNKSSKERADEEDMGSDDGSRSSTESRSEVFVRTKAANISSFEDPLDMNLDTMKHADKRSSGPAAESGS